MYTASWVISSLTGTDCNEWHVSDAALAHANADTAIGNWGLSCTSSQMCIKYIGDGPDLMNWEVTQSGLPLNNSSVQFGFLCGAGCSGGANQSVYSGIAHTGLGTRVECYCINYATEPCRQDGTGGVRAPVPTLNPERYFECMTTMSDGTTKISDSAIFHETDATSPRPTMPAIPAGKVPVTVGSDLLGGPIAIHVIPTVQTISAYQAWRALFPECGNGSCLTDLRKDGLSCFFQQVNCDGWVTATNQASTYSCYVGTHTVDLSECNIYGPVFNSANRASGNAYGDPRTGAVVAGQTSPSDVDEVTGKLLTRAPIETNAFVALADKPATMRLIASQCLEQIGLPSSASPQPGQSPIVPLSKDKCESRGQLTKRNKYHAKSLMAAATEYFAPGRRGSCPSVGWDPPIEGGDRDAEVSGDVGWGCAVSEQFRRCGDLAFGHDAFATGEVTFCAGGGKACLGSFDRELAFHLRERRHDVEEEPAGWRRGVDLVSQRTEAHTVSVELFGEVDEVLHRPAESVKFPDDEGIASANLLERLC